MENYICINEINSNEKDLKLSMRKILKGEIRMENGNGTSMFGYPGMGMRNTEVSQVSDVAKNPFEFEPLPLKVNYLRFCSPADAKSPSSIEIHSLRIRGFPVQFHKSVGPSFVMNRMNSLPWQHFPLFKSYFYDGSGFFYRSPESLPIFSLPNQVSSPAVRLEMQFRPFASDMVLFVFGNQVLK